MSHYTANTRDIEFNLFDILQLGPLLDSGAYGDLDSESVRGILVEVARLAEGPVAESFVDADRNPVQFVPEEHTITVPDSLRRTVEATHAAGWAALGLPEEMGGVDAPATLMWATQEMFAAANPAALFFHMGPPMHFVLFNEGTEEQKRWAAHAFAEHWGGTMVLTEPDAGSDVGAARTKAIAQPDGTWHIEGVKRFISGGDVGDTAENILHLVLARPEGAGPGTKGLSLFVVPKVQFDSETFELGERNGVYLTGVEHKMGLKSSPTCELSFGLGDRPAVGYLVGDVHNGIAQMFKVIENARMMVGTKSAGTLSAGYLTALDYAKQRIQGADLAKMAEKDSPRVTIIRHPDVRRSLMFQKAYTEGLRALYLFTAAFRDARHASHAFGLDEDAAARVNDFLLPVVKGVGSERAYEMLTEALQTLGGSGYLQDYPIEQYIRDVKIDSLYEGTTAIQAQDFYFRKILRDNEFALNYISDEIQRFIETDASAGALAEERKVLAQALADVASMTASMGANLTRAGEDPDAIYTVGLASVRYLMAVGDVLIAWLLLRQAEIALTKPADRADPAGRAFLDGKVAVARFFTANALPLLSGVRDVVNRLEPSVMRIDEAAF
ncbi:MULTISPECIES: acyl-CoA dehydrogenase [Rhodococcus]|uniref:acyl-CoA dehydrogenase n=1 Tax=Rhodococcus TaxID=1827 RepID=UPI001E4324AD|nr:MULTISPECIES: acyl-CoA dehydrogenase [Rhodococcus]BDB59425.1 acyl-CoA dehydrogenase [Rhodococcus sp. RDE2]